MELALLLYAASVADNMRNGLSFFTVLFFILGLIGIVIVFFTSMGLSDAESGSESQKSSLKANRFGRKVVIVCLYSWVALMLVTVLIPARRDVYVMAGGYVALKAANSEVVQTTANSVLGSIEKWLDKEMAKALPTNDSKKKDNK